MIAAIVLAAGAGTRFGGPKVVAQHDGMPLVRHVVMRLHAARVSHVIVAASAHATAIADALVDLETTLVHVPGGGAMSDSLRAGTSALPDECDAFLVALGDQPLIDPAVVALLVSTWETSNAAAVVPIYAGGQQGHPVLFDATLRRHFATLTGDRGARDLLTELGERVARLGVEAPVPRDVDTPDDLRQLDP